MVLSEGLHLLSNVTVWRQNFETINDKNVALWHRYYTDVINYYIMKENHHEMINGNNNRNKEYSTSDGWEVFRFQVRLIRFKTVYEFLEYWFHEYNKRQESTSRIEPIYMKNHTKNQLRQGPTGVRQY